MLRRLGLERQTGELLPVSLDRIGVANVSLVWVRARVALRATLSEQIPAAVELDLHIAKSLLIGFEGFVVVGLLAGAKLVLFGDEALDPVGDGFVAHATSLRHA
jgi:hypothetical protein